MLWYFFDFEVTLHMSYKLIAFDLDHTLLNKETLLSEENSRALSTLVARGVTVVPNSGRTFTEMPDFIRNHPAFRYLLHSDGAVIFDKATGKRYCEYMQPPLLDEILGVLRSYETLITYRTGGVSYVKRECFNDDSLAYYQMGELYKRFLYETNRPCDDLDALMENETECEMMCVFFHDDRELEACRKRLAENESIIVASSAPHNIEIFSTRAGKGTALLRLADLLGIDHGETIAVGDSENDMDMVCKAGLGLAMKNGRTLLKNAADAVLDCTNDEHVAEYLLKAYY